MLRTIAAAIMLAGPPAHAKEPPPPRAAVEVTLYRNQLGVASVYANGDGHEGSKTANGERVDPKALTAAHRTLPFGAIVEVANRRNGRTVEVRINDRGPFVAGRVIDLTPAGAKALGFSGLADVELEVVSTPPDRGRASPRRFRDPGGYPGASGRK